jgi:hypothetical protein
MPWLGSMSIGASHITTFGSMVVTCCGGMVTLA